MPGRTLRRQRWNSSLCAMLLFLAFLAAGAREAFACSCVAAQGACALPPAPIAFVGTVRTIERAAAEGIGPFAVTFDVLEPLRGTVEKTMVVRADLESGGSCGLPFAIGEEWLVFANQSGAALYTGVCQQSQRAKAGAATIRQLRAIRAGTMPAGVFGMVSEYAPAGRFAQGANEVTIIARSDAAERRTVTATDGSYEFRDLPPGRYSIIVQLKSAPSVPGALRQLDRFEPLKTVQPGGAGSCSLVDFQVSVQGPPIPAAPN